MISILALVFTLQAGLAQVQSEGEPPVPIAIASSDHAAWKTEISNALQQLDLLELLGKITQIHPISVNVPGDLQRVPLENTKGMEAIAKQIEIRVTKLYLDKLSFQRPDQTLWSADHPLLPTMVSFGEIRVNAEAKTPAGIVPLEGTFLGGALPADFDIFRDRLELHPTPARRQNEGKIDSVKVTSTVPLVGPILTKLAGKDLAKALLNAGVGKTLTLKQGELLGSEGGGLGSVLPLLKKGGDAAEGGKGGVGSLLDSLLK